ERRKSPAGHDDEAVDGREPVRLKRHAPVNRGERHRQSEEKYDGAGDVLHLPTHARVARVILLGRPAIEPRREEEPDAEVDGGAQHEERDVQVSALMLERRVARDDRRVRPLVERARLTGGPALVYEEREDDWDEEDGAERDGARRGLEESSARQRPCSARHVSEREPREAADRDARA